MLRQVDLKEISDGRLYGSRDMVRAGCQDCAGCHACCQGMGNTVVLDPWDLYWMSAGLGSSFDQLLAEGYIRLGMADGIILPSLSMSAPGESCTFLDENNRCRIHPFRPGFCRLFPLGRYYENGSFRYFLQIHECRKQDRTKVKVQKWLGISNLRRYESFVLKWHDYLDEVREKVRQASDGHQVRAASMDLLNRFYRCGFQPGEDTAAVGDCFGRPEGFGS